MLEKAGDLIKAFGGQLLHRLFMFFVALLALFAFLRNGDLIATAARHRTADRIFGDPGEGLVEKMVDAVRGTVNGTVMVAVTEGLLIGIAYLAAGVPNPVLFTILTIAFAMLPFGAWAAFTRRSPHAPASAAAAALRHLRVFAWGAVVMLAGDHFVWPTLVGGAARLPFLFAFVGIFGGLATFGLLGLFLGPVVMAALADGMARVDHRGQTGNLTTRYFFAGSSTMVLDDPSGAACIPGGVCPCGLSAGAPPVLVSSGPVCPCGCNGPCFSGITVRPVEFGESLPRIRRRRLLSRSRCGGEHQPERHDCDAHAICPGEFPGEQMEGREVPGTRCRTANSA